MAEVVEYKDFYANCDHMPGKKRALRVGGTVVCPTTDWSGTLQEYQRSGPPPFNPLILELELVMEEPMSGGEALTPVEVGEFVIEEPPLDYYAVYIFGDREHGDGPGQVTVVHTQ